MHIAIPLALIFLMTTISQFASVSIRLGCLTRLPILSAWYALHSWRTRRISKRSNCLQRSGIVQKASWSSPGSKAIYKVSLHLIALARGGLTAFLRLWNYVALVKIKADLVSHQPVKWKDYKDWLLSTVLDFEEVLRLIFLNQGRFYNPEVMTCQKRFW